MQSIVTKGTVLPANLPALADNPQFQTPNGFTFGVDELIYVPSGWFFYVANAVINAQSLVTMVVQDLPAAPGVE